MPTGHTSSSDQLWAEYLRAVDADLTGLSAIDIARILRYRRRLFARIYEMFRSPSPNDAGSARQTRPAGRSPVSSTEFHRTRSTSPSRPIRGAPLERGADVITRKQGLHPR